MNHRNCRFSKQNANTTRKKIIVVFIGIIFINLAVFGALLINNPSFSGMYGKQDGFDIRDDNTIQSSQGADPSLVKDPYTTNFNETWKDFFEKKFQSDLGYAIETYYREGSADGTITEDLVYSLDNLLLYNTLPKYIYEYDASQIWNKYTALKDTKLWYEGSGAYEYGFVDSVDNTTKDVNNYRRYLLDNLMPIFLLGENIDDSVGQSYIDEIETIFTLINSSQFFDAGQFKHYNSSTGETYALDHLYGTLAMLLLNQTAELNDQIQIRAGQMANQTMETLFNSYWDISNIGYDYSGSNNEKDLETNALGIITLIEYGKMVNNSDYIENSTSLFEKIDSTLLYEGIYMNSSDATWGTNTTNIADLKSNSIMMRACVELFEMTGNRSYYNSAIEIYNSFESDFYDEVNKAYRKANIIGTGTINNKNLLYNLRQSEAYFAALEVYENSSLTSSFNKTELIPEFMFDQETLKLTTNYSYTSNYAKSGIPDANITYSLRYPNGDIFENFTRTTDENGTNTFLYNISSDLTLGEDYSILIFANKSFHKYANITKYFDVTGGIKYESGLEDEDEYYQSATQNITLILNNTRNSNINLNFSVEADSILVNEPKEYLLNISQLNEISANFTIKNDAEPGDYSFHFILKNESTVYFDYVKTIEIKNALQITNFIYDSEVVKGDILQINLTTTNFLENNTQSFNLSISGDYIDDINKQEHTLAEEEIKIISNDCNVSNSINSDTIQVEIRISKGDTTFYTKSITLEVVDIIEIIDCSFSKSATQGSSAYLILVVKNNLKRSQEYTLYINSWKITGSLEPGENTIRKSVVPTINPYDFTPKTYSIKLYDQQSNEIYRNSFTVYMELSVMFLVLCYILPILVPIAIVIYFKNKQVKMDKLRRR